MDQPRWTPHATVATVVFAEDKFLVVEELSQNQPVFNQPAGHVEAGETLVEAAKRETLEETGYHVSIEGLVGLYTYTAPSNSVTYHRYCFFGSVTDFDPNHPLDVGIIGPRWLSLEELKNSDKLRSPMVLTCYQDYLKGNRFPLNIITEHP